MGRPGCVVVEKRTSWQRFVEVGRDPRVIALLEEGHASIDKMKAAHAAHVKSTEAVRQALEAAGYALTVISGTEETFDASAVELVVTVGGDGTLLSASHRVASTPILGVNSAPEHSVGHFCGATEESLPEVLARLSRGDLPSVSLARMTVTKNGEVVSSRVLNDALFCHASPAATSRYRLEIGDDVETQKSSGFWIGPPAGSTAAQRSAGGEVLPLDAELLQLVVREPYDPEGRPLRLARRVVGRDEVLRVESRMHDASVFVDGPTDMTPVAFGDTLTFTVSSEHLTLVGVSKERGRSSGPRI